MYLLVPWDPYKHRQPTVMYMIYIITIKSAKRKANICIPSSPHSLWLVYSIPTIFKRTRLKLPSYTNSDFSSDKLILLSYWFCGRFHVFIERLENCDVFRCKIKNLIIWLSFLLWIWKIKFKKIITHVHSLYAFFPGNNTILAYGTYDDGNVNK